MQRSRPDTFQPPYPAFSSHFSEGQSDYVMAMLGIQRAPGATGDSLLSAARALAKIEGSGRPLHVEQAWHVDAYGYRNDVLLLYWLDRAAQAAFWSRADVSAWMAQPLTGSVGWWRESLSAPLTAHDGNYAVSDSRYGLGRHTDQHVEQYHSYYGSMRDRVPDYLAGKADAPAGQIVAVAPAASFGQRLRCTDMPRNLCFIRGAFGWDKATPEEQQAFIDDMLPVFKTGADYLRDNSEEANCISMRFLEEVDVGLDNGVQVEVNGWFLSLKDLERWTHSHPTHQAIFGGVFVYMRRFNFEARLNLGHEVAVVPEGQLEAEYSNCHPNTGLLRFFPSQPVS
jgi:aldoxime dehydratase